MSQISQSVQRTQIINSLNQPNGPDAPTYVLAGNADQTGLLLGATNASAPATATAPASLNGRGQYTAIAIERTQAPAAAGTATATRAALMGATYLNTIPTLTDGQQGSLLLDTRNNAKVTVVDGDGTTTWKMQGTAVDTLGNTISAMRTAGFNYAYNGASWDRIRSSANLTGVQLTSTRADISGGATPYCAISAGNTTPVAMKASTGQIFGGSPYNLAASVRYLRLFDVAAGSVVPGTTVPTYIIPIEATGQAPFPIGVGLQFSTAISWFVTTDGGLLGNAAGSAGDVVLSFGIK